MVQQKQMFYDQTEKSKFQLVFRKQQTKGAYEVGSAVWVSCVGVKVPTTQSLWLCRHKVCVWWICLCFLLKMYATSKKLQVFYVSIFISKTIIKVLKGRWRNPAVSMSQSQLSESVPDIKLRKFGFFAGLLLKRAKAQVKTLLIMTEGDIWIGQSHHVVLSIVIILKLSHRLLYTVALLDFCFPLLLKGKTSAVTLTVFCNQWTAYEVY